MFPSIFILCACAYDIACDSNSRPHLCTRIEHNNIQPKKSYSIFVSSNIWNWNRIKLLLMVKSKYKTHTHALYTMPKKIPSIISISFYFTYFNMNGYLSYYDFMRIYICMQKKIYIFSEKWQAKYFLLIVFCVSIFSLL